LLLLAVVLVETLVMMEQAEVVVLVVIAQALLKELFLVRHIPLPSVLVAQQEPMESELEQKVLILFLAP
jgi:hypothetical protein